ncbi:MAG: polysaccharide deacetylase family protein, partial [Candidatus Omnitrophica bacterium]|nr:polysaccharide deacetylase family protein [Candidatus Omnitrophota bacterium]
MRYAINHGREVPILLYHGVGLPDPNQDNLPLEEFRLQMRHLAEKGFHPILLSDLLDHVEGKTDLPSHPIVITFDDGVKTTYTNAFPVLKEYRFPATVFLVSDYIGEGTKWLSTLEHRWYDRDPRLNSPENDIWKFDFLSWEEVKEMGKAQVGFGSHGATHAELPRLTPKELLYELEGSKEKLETALGQKVDCFAYPWGFFNE